MHGHVTESTYLMLHGPFGLAFPTLADGYFPCCDLDWNEELKLVPWMVRSGIMGEEQGLQVD